MTNDYANDLVHTMSAMITATEPRVVALLPAAFLEAHLQALILKRLPAMRAELRDKLFGSEGAFSPLSAKIDVAEALGCISQDLAKHASFVARIRNRFAHRIDVRDFDHPDVVKLNSKLKEINKAMPPEIFHEGGWRPITKNNDEGWFIAAALSVCCAVSAELFGGDFDIKIEHPEEPGKFQTIRVQRTPEAPKVRDQAGQ